MKAVVQWLKDLVKAMRDIAGAVSHARSHPTDLQDR